MSKKVKAKPVYSPKNAKKHAAEYVLNEADLKARGLKKPPVMLFAGGRRRFSARLVILTVSIRMKPRMRIVQGNLKPMS